MSRRRASKTRQRARKARNATKHARIMACGAPGRVRDSVALRGRRGDAAVLRLVTTGVVLRVVGRDEDGDPVLSV